MSRCDRAEARARNDFMAECRGLPRHAVAIIGLAGRFPGADDLGGFWANIANGVECLDVPTDADLDVPPALFDTGYSVPS